MVVGRLRDVSVAQLAGELVEQFRQPTDQEAAQVADAVIVQFSAFQRDKHDALEHVWRGVIRGAHGEGRLAHAARSVDQRAPRAALGVQGVGDLA